MTVQTRVEPERVETVVQGSYRISAERTVVLSTVLGSCVAVCLHDPVARIGGMNHFLLAEDRGGSSASVKYGTHAMELLINDLLKNGARRDGLVAKAFGGASMSANLADIGSTNADFARRFLKREGIRIAAESLGGELARRVRFWPASGQARVLQIPRLDPHAEPLVEPRAPAPISGDITLF